MSQIHDFISGLEGLPIDDELWTKVKRGELQLLLDMRTLQNNTFGLLFDINESLKALQVQMERNNELLAKLVLK